MPAISSTVRARCGDGWAAVCAQAKAAVTPQFSLNALSITADRDLGPYQALRLGVGQGFNGSRATSFQVGDVLHTGYGDLSLTGNYTQP